MFDKPTFFEGMVQMGVLARLAVDAEGWMW